MVIKNNYNENKKKLKKLNNNDYDNCENPL